MSRTRVEVAAAAVRWIAYALAVLLVLFWGAFFVEHLNEWFLHAGGIRDADHPPARIWLAQCAHGGILIGLLAMLRWDRLGAVLTIVSTVAFFSLAGFRGFSTIALINLPPIVLLLLAGWLRSTRTRLPVPG
jgi:hypothetical protein